MVRAEPLPEGALLRRYDTPGGYVDCYAAEIGSVVSLPELIAAFYDSPAFRPERWLIGAALGKRAGSADVARLAAGEIRAFSAWTVEHRAADQLLLRDFRRRTRSWLMVEPRGAGTSLRFGSAVVPARRWLDRMIVRALMGFHRAYSRVLLRAAVRRLQARQRQ